MDGANLVLDGGLSAMLLAGAVIDLRTRRIPNALTFGGALVGLAANIAVNQQAGAIASLEGWSVGVLLLAIPLLNRMIGGGDVKLLAAAGAFGGPGFVVRIALYAAIVGGAMSIGFLIANRGLGTTARPLLFWLRMHLALVLATIVPLALSLTPSGATTGFVADRPESRGRLYLPYGPALAIGGIAALFLR